MQLLGAISDDGRQFRQVQAQAPLSYARQFNQRFPEAYTARQQYGRALSAAMRLTFTENHVHALLPEAIGQYTDGGIALFQPEGILPLTDEFLGIQRMAPLQDINADMRASSERYRGFSLKVTDRYHTLVSLNNRNDVVVKILRQSLDNLIEHTQNLAAAMAADPKINADRAERQRLYSNHARPRYGA